MNARRLNILLLAAVVMSMLGITAWAAETQASAGSAKDRPFGLDKVIGFYGAPTDIAAANFVLSGDWKYWSGRGGVASRGITHQQFLRKTADEAANVLVNLDFQGSPSPSITIDEFGCRATTADRGAAPISRPWPGCC